MLWIDRRLEMNRIVEEDWSFGNIRRVDWERAARLESAEPPDDLVRTLAQALDETVGREEFRIAVDSRDNTFIERRTIVQFQISPTLYDWFFNARTGYRSRFWIDPKIGLAFNRDIAETLTKVLTRRLPATVTARRIMVVPRNESRNERDIGTIEIARDEIVRSLAPDASKMWICERLYSQDGGQITDIGFAVLSDAERSRAKLCVPRWAEARNPKTGEKGEGLRAPRPGREESWLDLKGGFLDSAGNSYQIKPQDERALHIHQRGWT
jgi:hypothetical protein